MKLAITALLAGSAAAFAPASMPKASTALNMAFESELGAQPPLGFFDPLGLVADGDQENSTAFVMLKSSTAVSVCLVLLDTLSLTPVSVSRVTLTTLEPPFLMFVTVSLHSMTSKVLALPKLLPSLVYWN